MAAALPPPSTGDTPFRTVERRYKLKDGKPPDLAGVLRGSSEPPPSDGSPRVVPIPDRPGAFYLPGLLSEGEQVALAKEALCEYADPAAAHDSNVPLAQRTWRDAATGVRHHSTLRWVTMGYFYDWTAKTYDKARASPLPASLKSLAAAKYTAVRDAVVAAAPTAAAHVPERVDFQTAIVNFYNHKSTLMGHTDTYEDPAVLHLPLLTVSLGRSAVFLVGGATKDTAPTPVLIESGDAVLLAGPSRVAFHGVPSILPDTCPRHLTDAFPLLAAHRINLSLRQVFPGAAVEEEEAKGVAAPATDASSDAQQDAPAAKRCKRD